MSQSSYPCSGRQVTWPNPIVQCAKSALLISAWVHMVQVAGILTGNAALVGKSLDSDIIIEPVRGPLIPGFAAVKAAANAAGESWCCELMPPQG